MKKIYLFAIMLIGLGMSFQSISQEVENVSNVVASDIGDNHNGSDLQVTFDVPDDESNIESYKVVAIDAATFPIQILELNAEMLFENPDAQDLFHIIQPTGGNQTVTFTADDFMLAVNQSTNSLDIHDIKENVEMYVAIYVQGENGVESALAQSNFITLTSDAVEVPNISNVVAEDISDNGDGTDLQVSFDVPADETGIEGYYLVVTTSEISSSIFETNYTGLFDGTAIKVDPTGSNITHTFSADDVYWFIESQGYVDYTEIEENVELLVHIYIQGDGNDYLDVVNASNPITLISGEIEEIENVSNVIASDIGDNHNGSDLQVTFEVPDDESNIESYKLLAVEASTLPFQTLETNAEGIFEEPGNQPLFQIVQPNGENQTVTFDADDLMLTFDQSSNQLGVSDIKENVEMYVAVYVQGENGVASLIAQSNNITLTSDAVEVPNISNVVAEDISDNGDGTDLQVSFDVPADETGIEGYYLVVTTSEITSQLFEANYTGLFDETAIKMEPTGSNITHTFSADDVYWFVEGQGLVDIIEIEEDVELLVHVYIQGDGNDYLDVVNVSNPITLTSEDNDDGEGNEGEDGEDDDDDDDDDPNSSVSKEELGFVNVYPNPAVNQVHIELEGLNEANVVVYSITGQEVVNTTIAGSTSTIDVSGLNNGVYICTVLNNKNEIVQSNKLIIRK